MTVLEEYIDTKRVKSANFKEASSDELLELKGKVDIDIAAIRMELETAKTNLETFGEHYDTDWFHRATIAKKIKGQLSQRIQAALGRKKSERKEKHRENFAEKLLEAMDSLIEPEAKREIVYLARDLLKE